MRTQNQYFNSIKVRLKRILNPIVSVSYEFQFHKGTIKTVDRHTVARYANEFQFHKGTIKTGSGYRFEDG